MQRNIRLDLSFDGTRYCGWQRQRHAPSIQAMLETRLATLTRDEVTLHGAGRTDAGVHALNMVANFHTSSHIDLAAFLHGLNSMLPEDIRILKATEVPKDFHSRFSATGKTYSYRFFTGQIMPPCSRLYMSHFPCSLEHTSIATALKHLQGTHDFTSFEGAGSRDPASGRGAVRTLFSAQYGSLADPDHWMLSFTGDGFLRHMVRNLVGTLIEIGRGKRRADDITAILAARDRTAAGPTAPACGLFLEQVHYQPLFSS
ncbi:MAG: tRNA pseudouridine(38-40) synthase TruA [Desulfobulbus propionicus]|nr:MAG: tRNA pseudouridine(38-40) synthase TruA [Desulfobulbus propionicus]